MRIKLISETAFTHEGDFSYLIAQIDLANKIGAEYIKFQVLLDIDSVYSKSTDLYNDMKSKMFNPEDWKSALKYAKSLGLKTLVLPIDYKALQFSIDCNYTDAIEIHSICLNDILFLNTINKSETKLLIVLGVGGRTTSDINFCINYLDSSNLLLMSGFQCFPTEIEDANLGKVKSLVNNYRFPIGYADHTPWDQEDSSMILTAISFGATFIEKHIILDNGSDRADYYSAVSEKEFMRLKNLIKTFTLIYGNDDLGFLSKKETTYKNRERKIIALSNIRKNTKLLHENIGYTVTNQSTDLEQKSFNKIIGLIAKEYIRKGETITSDKII
jgi:N,N'-diacetyllegionaminate synthase